MTLSEEEFADKDDSLLLKTIKLQHWDEAATTLAGVTTMAQKPDKYGNLPLHAAIGYKAPDALILAIIQAYPQATRVHGTDDWLPLHIAAMWGASPQVMETLIRQYPEALDDHGEEGIKGRTPRHFRTRFVHNKVLLERSTNEWIELIESEKKAEATNDGFDTTTTTTT
jgi:hypothetical protein